jgi:hypothetical protein
MKYKMCLICTKNDGLIHTFILFILFVLSECIIQINYFQREFPIGISKYTCSV